MVLLRGRTEVARWALTVTGATDLAAVDLLARLQLAARRRGCSIRVRNASAELFALLDLAGLSRCLEVGGEPEDGEQPGVEEVVVPDDPVA